MKRIKNNMIILSLIAVTLVLTGCSKLNDYVQNEVTKASESEIHSSTEYQQYEQYQSDGILSENGLFPTPAPSEADTFCFVKKNIKFSKLESDISTILKDHPAIHFITLNLVFADEAGSFTYKLDGKEVSSSPLIKVRVGQTLKVEYRADSGYTITHSWFGANAFYDAFTWAGGTDSISESIKISADMDGATINRETFGIVVEEAG